MTHKETNNEQISRVYIQKFTWNMPNCIIWVINPKMPPAAPPFIFN